jgi:hypothetical protein
MARAPSQRNRPKGTTSPTTFPELPPVPSLPPGVLAPRLMPIYGANIRDEIRLLGEASVEPVDTFIQSGLYMIEWRGRAVTMKCSDAPAPGHIVGIYGYGVVSMKEFEEIVLGRVVSCSPGVGERA